MEHLYTYPTVIPLPRDRSRAAAQALDAERRMGRPASDRSATGRARPEHASTSSGGSDGPAS
jgi:hypothetical protein